MGAAQAIPHLSAAALRWRGSCSQLLAAHPAAKRNATAPFNPQASEKVTSTVPNTNLVLAPDSRLFALNEAGAPFVLELNERTGAASSHQYETWGGRLDFPMSAHPKVDIATGEMFFHGYAMAEEGRAKALQSARPCRHHPVTSVHARAHLSPSVPQCLDPSTTREGCVPSFRST